jgi:DNA polymerase III subunit epsilon
MLHDSLIVLDFETTGLHAEAGDRITEVGLVRIQGGCITERFQSLVNCGVRVPDYITAYTGITQRMVDGAPPVAQVLREVAAFIGETPVIAHNASFDQRFFVRECRRQRIGVVVEPFICSLRLARRVYPQLESHSLGVLAHRLQLRSCGAAHRAAADAEMTAQLMQRMAEDITAQHGALNLTAQVLRRLMHVPVKQVPAQLERLCA